MKLSSMFTQQLLNFTEFNICKPILKRYKTNDASPEALAELEKPTLMEY